MKLSALPFNSLILLFCCTMILLANETFAQPSQAKRPKVIVLGFDGADPNLLEKWMDDGSLPNLAKLRDEGSYRRLGTTNPAQSPVSWSCFETGTNPGKTGIMGFLKRINTRQKPIPILASATESSKKLFPHPSLRILTPVSAGALVGAIIFLALRFILRVSSRRAFAAAFAVGLTLIGVGVYSIVAFLPENLPVAVNNRQGDSVWKLLSKDNIRTSVILAPITFPPEEFPNGKLLSGLGVPDVRGHVGLWFIYTNDPSVSETDLEMGGLLINVTVENDAVDAFVQGPPNLLVKERIGRIEDLLRKRRLPIQKRSELESQIASLEKLSYVKIPLHIRLNKRSSEGAETATITCQGRSQTLHKKEWSDWFEFQFKISPLMKVHAIGRFCLLKFVPYFKLYLSPVQLHPAKLPPTINISYPRDFSAELVSKIGLFDTLGWAAPTNPLKEEQIDESVFMDGLWLIMKKREEIVYHELAKRDWDCFIAIFSATDRVQHVMWRLIDTGHPIYDEQLAAQYGDAILEVYKEMDDIVGAVKRDYVDKDDNVTLIVVSDHGFQSFRHGVNLNTWLVQNGYMKIRGDATQRKLSDLFDPKNIFKNVVWRETKAYSLGLGKIFINMREREPQGIVMPGPEYDEVRQEISTKLEKLTAPDTGEKVVVAAYKREGIFQGKYVKDAADIFLGFNKGYRVSWQTCLGGWGDSVIVDNTNKWSGDHCSVDPSLVPGIFLCNRKISVAPGSDSLHITDMTPTILKIFGQPIPKEIDGRALSLDR